MTSAEKGKGQICIQTVYTLGTKGERGSKNPQNSVDVIYEKTLKINSLHIQAAPRHGAEQRD